MSVVYSVKSEGWRRKIFLGLPPAPLLSFLQSVAAHVGTAEFHHLFQRAATMLLVLTHSKGLLLNALLYAYYTLSL